MKTRRDGFFNMVAPLLPSLGEGQSTPPEDGGPIPVPPAPPNIPTENGNFEVDYSSLSCPSLTSYMQKLNNLLLTTRDEQVYAYYSSKLDLATAAYNAKCKESVSGGGGTKDPVKDPVKDPITTIQTLITGAIPGGGGSGAGGGGGSTTAAKKKMPNWLWIIIAGAVVIIAAQSDKSGGAAGA